MSLATLLRSAATVSILSLYFAMAGCANTRTNPAKINTAKSDMVCTKEKRTGSNRPVVTCRTKTQAEIDRTTAQRIMKETKSRTQ